MVKHAQNRKINQSMKIILAALLVNKGVAFNPLLPSVLNIGRLTKILISI